MENKELKEKMLNGRHLFTLKSMLNKPKTKVDYSSIFNVYFVKNKSVPYNFTIDTLGNATVVLHELDNTKIVEEGKISNDIFNTIIQKTFFKNKKIGFKEQLISVILLALTLPDTTINTTDNSNEFTICFEYCGVNSMVVFSYFDNYSVIKYIPTRSNNGIYKIIELWDYYINNALFEILSNYYSSVQIDYAYKTMNSNNNLI